MIIVGAHKIVSSLGFTSKENFDQVINGVSGIQLYETSTLSDVPLQASKLSSDQWLKIQNEILGYDTYSRLEQLAITSLKEVISDVDVKNKKTGLLVSTTKGNVDVLSNGSVEDVELSSSAKKIANYFGFVSTPQVVCNACISGLAAFIVAKRLIDANQYDQVVIVGVDILSKFIVSGFQSFQSLSSNPCKPFDENRDGLSLGEAAASIVLKRVDGQQDKPVIEVVNGAISNDANHISGPSRTGEGLYRAIKNSTLNDSTIDAICAHGTATPYNDDMESFAINRSGYSDVPVFGLKGYFGHTLGAAGVLESILSIMVLQNNVIPGTKGLVKQGVVQDINVVKDNRDEKLNSILKLMSGFGGCNAAVYFKKHE